MDVRIYEKERITEALAARLGRGVTLLKSQGGYSKMDSTVVYVIISRLELAKLKSMVLEPDRDALITVGSVEAAGRKYKKKAIH